YPDVPVILDAKRGDIGSTSAAYATAAFDVCGADAITLQPYLGYDAIAPFIERADRGMFIVCRTSNQGSDEVQGLFAARAPEPTGNVRDPDDPTAPEPLYLQVARLVARDWNHAGNCGLVVGATYPEELGAVRALVGDMPILVPGVGVQGGDLEGVVRLGLDSLHTGLLISLSRSVLYASADHDFAYAARREVMRVAEEVERYRR
ncbi:MAG: orotidine-5'-phosphate decarboxylase, partial [Ktedonobacterales bacterium]